LSHNGRAQPALVQRPGSRRMTTIGSTPETTTVYGMPADRAAAVDEVHARPHPLL